MPFDALQVSLQLVAALADVVPHIPDRDLVDQLRRAATSVSLNLSEGRRRAGKDRLHCWRIAAGSADEVRTALQVAVAWRYVEQAAVDAALGLADRVLAMTWRMTR
jgi:four helix bundle protein